MINGPISFGSSWNEWNVCARLTSMSCVTHRCGHPWPKTCYGTSIKLWCFKSVYWLPSWSTRVCIALASTISHSYHSIITFGEWLIQTRETAFETVEHTVISGASLILVHSKRGTCMNTLSVLVAYGGCPYILTMHCPLTRLRWPCMWSDS